jgi:uncharacterized protein
MKTLIIILTKYPEAGKVKSRLARSIGEEKASKIYEALLWDNWHNAKISDQQIRLEYSPPEAKYKFKKMFGDDAQLHLQEGKDIGWRMANAFDNCWQQRFDAAILIGGDVPDIFHTSFSEALDSLKKHDIVIGPSTDGGYYLIGFQRKSFDYKFFQNIDWSTNRVFEQTSKIIRNTNNKLYLIEKRNDLDTFDDVKEFLESNKASSWIAEKIHNILECEVSCEDKVNIVHDSDDIPFDCPN